MKIVIPVDANIKETDVCMSFGRAPYYMLYNTEDSSYEFIKNTAATSPGGAGIQAAQTVVDLKVDALLTPRCGQNAADIILGANIKVYKTLHPSVQYNIKEFLDNKLNPLSEIHSGYHNHGNY